MSEQIIQTIGTIHRKKMDRDAIHSPLLQAKAAHPLVQGTTVKVDEHGNATHVRREEAIGIVDPFLTRAVEAGEKFWVFILPGKITGMKHHFELPIPGVKSEAETLAKDWLTRYATGYGLEYDELIVAVTNYIDNGAMLDDNFDDREVPEEFWTHFRTVTGLQGEGHFWTCCPG